jgi:hypothetical protein
MKVNVMSHITASPDLTLPETMVAIVATISVENGEVTLNLGGLYDYHCPATPNKFGPLISRAVKDRDKYPHWPDPEPRGKRSRR